MMHVVVFLVLVLFCEGGSSPGGGVIIPGSGLSERPYFCCVKKNEGSNEPSPLGFHMYPVKVSNTSLFHCSEAMHFSEEITLLIVRDLISPR